MSKALGPKVGWEWQLDKDVGVGLGLVSGGFRGPQRSEL